MNNIRRAIDERLKLINFDDLYKGFREYDYAIYDDEYVYLKDKIISKDQRFIGNTAIKYDDSYLAIWYKPDGDKDILTSNIIHEMFHCYQYDTKIPFSIDDINATKNNLDKEYLELKHLEKKYLVEAIKTLNENAYSKVLSIRNKRKTLNTVYDYELSIETLEGVAESCKLNALKILNQTTFVKVINDGCDYLLKEHFDTRRLAYYTGAYMNILDSVYPDSQADTRYNIKTEVDLEEEVVSFNEYNNNQFLPFIKSEKINGNICGYDPMNMLGRDREILHKHFVMIDVNGNKKFYKGPIITVYNENAFEVVEIKT